MAEKNPRDSPGNEWTEEFMRVQAVTASGEDYPAGAIRGRIAPVDSDGDSVPDYLDVCPGTEPGAAVDTNGCSVAQHCPCLGFWQNHWLVPASLLQMMCR